MNNEHLEEIKNIIKYSDYKNHYKLQDYFEVEYIDELVQYVEQLENIRKEVIEVLERHTRYSTGELLNILNKGSECNE